MTFQYDGPTLPNANSICGYHLFSHRRQLFGLYYGPGIIQGSEDYIIKFMTLRGLYSSGERQTVNKQINIY